MPVTYEFADFKVDPELGKLLQRGYTVPLQDQCFRLLELLLSRAGSVVSREELKVHLWPGNTNVEFDLSLRVAVTKLREALCDSAVDPTYIETIHRRGYRFIGEVKRVEKPVPAAFVHGQSEKTTTSEALIPPAGAIPVPAVPASDRIQPPTARMSHRAWWLAIAATAIVVLGIALGLARLENRRTAPSPSVSEAVVRRTVAVVGLRNLSGVEQDQWLSTGLAEMFSSELAGSGQLRMISGEEVARAGLSKASEESPSKATLDRFSKELGADILVFGGFAVTRTPQARNSPQVRLDLRIVDSTTDAPPITLVETGQTSNLFALVSATGTEMRRRLGLAPLSGEWIEAVRTTLPENPEAARLYVEGLNRLRDFDPLGAKYPLERAAQLAPAHAGIHLALAEDWIAMGYNERARQEASTAADHTARLPRDEVLEIQGEKAFLSSDFASAVQVFQSLLTFYPDEVRYGLRLARAQRMAGHPDDALAMLAKLNRPGLSAADEMRIELARSNLDAGVGNFPDALKTADRVIAIASDLGQNHVIADGLWRKAIALERMSKDVESLEATRRAQELYRASGDKAGLAVTLLASGDVLYDQAKYAQAREDFQAAVTAYREIGHGINATLSLERVGNTYFGEGDLEKAREYYRQTLAGYRTIPWKEGIPSALGNLANVQQRLGELKEALKANSEALDLFRATGDQRGAAETLANMGNIELDMGDLTSAEASFRQALVEEEKIHYVRGLAGSQIDLGFAMIERADPTGALQMFASARKAMGAETEPSIDRQILDGEGEAYLAAGHPQQALDSLGKALAIDDGDHMLSVRVLSAASRAELELKHLDRALMFAQRAEGEAQKQSGSISHASAQVSLAQVQLALGKPSLARETLRAPIEAATRCNGSLLLMEARILNARTIESAGERRKQLDNLARDASAHGWRRLSSMARNPNS